MTDRLVEKLAFNYIFGENVDKITAIYKQLPERQKALFIQTVNKHSGYAIPQEKI